MSYLVVKPKREPTGCIEEKPTRQSICLGGRWINLSALARSQGMDKSYLSRIFSGDRPSPTLDYLKKMAAGLGMGIEELANALEERYALVKSRHTELEILHVTRVTEENEADLKTVLKNKPVVSRMPGTRLPSEEIK